jgi:hypothetical protein
MSNSCFDTISFPLWFALFKMICLVPFHDFQPFQQNSSFQIPQFGLSYCALKKEFTNIIHGHNNWHDHAFLDRMSSTKIHTTCLEEQPKRQLGRTDLIKAYSKRQLGRTDLIKAYSKTQMVRKIPTILACVIFRLGKKIINDILP